MGIIKRWYRKTESESVQKLIGAVLVMGLLIFAYAIVGGVA